jgi:hypothetical protein
VSSRPDLWVLFQFETRAGLFLNPPETADHVRHRVVSAIAQGIRFPPLSHVTPELWGQLPSALADEIAARYATSVGLDPLASASVGGMRICLAASHAPESIIVDFDQATKSDQTTIQNAIRMVIEGVSSHRPLDVLSSTLSAARPVNDLYRYCFLTFSSSQWTDGGCITVLSLTTIWPMWSVRRMA